MQRIAKSILFAVLFLGAFAPNAFGAFITNFHADVLDNGNPGQVVTQAGSTPHVGVTDFTLDSTILGEQVKTIRVDLPTGLISNPQATPQCTQVDFNADSCDAKTQIGQIDITALGLPLPTAAVYNLVPTAGHLSDFGFTTVAIPGLLSAVSTHIIGGVRDTGDYGLFFTIDVPNGLSLSHSKLTFFGNPGDPVWGTGASPAPFIRLPTVCAGPQTTKLTVDTYQGHTYTDTSTTATGAAGCDQLPFDPSVSVTPDTTQRDTPAGVAVDVHVPWETDPTKLASSHVKDTAIVLPPGMSINPAAATGLAACTDDQLGQGTDNPIGCPAASKVGTASIDSPVLSAPLTGTVYLGQPLPDNPYRLFVEVHGFGLSVRLKGTVAPDPNTGQLTTTFAATPQVPFTDFTLNLSGGPNATLATPLACGSAATTSAITPYSGAAPSTPGASFTVDGPGCPGTPFSLGFSAGSQNMAAGAFSPFTLTVSRPDGQQYLSGLTVRQPAGLLGLIQSVPLCDEALASHGTCPDSSRVGSATVAAGAGSAPFTLTGPVYLSGPYGGGPFGLVIVIRALAGPFDLGTVVVRAAIKIDQNDSHLTIDTPSLPTILQGIPLRLRTVAVSIDRSGFLFNPTNCDQLAVGATLTSADGATQDISSPFQATGCDALPYAPKLSASTRPATTGKPAGLTVNLSQAAGEANTKSVSVHLPTQLAARLDTVSKACPQATFQADPSKCAAGSRVGTVAAATPLLAAPLSGPVYLEAHQAGKLPTLEALLQGSGITVDLSGTIVLGKGITSTFGAVPDVPITSFKLDLPPGPGSALSATADLCAAPLSFTATILGQNGKSTNVSSLLDVPGCGVQITTAKVRGRTVTVRLRVPAPGTVKLSAKGLKTVRKTLKKAGSTQVRLKLTKTGVASLTRALRNKKKSKRKLTVKIKASYTPKRGQTAGGEAVKASSATRKVTFKR